MFHIIRYVIIAHSGIPKYLESWWCDTKSLNYLLMLWPAITVSEVKGILTRLNKQQSVKGKVKVFTADALKICFTEELVFFSLRFSSVDVIGSSIHLILRLDLHVSPSALVCLSQSPCVSRCHWRSLAHHVSPFVSASSTPSFHGGLCLSRCWQSCLS